MDDKEFFVEKQKLVMNYRIYPLSNKKDVDGAITRVYDDLVVAKQDAHAIARKYGCDVIVYKKVGTYFNVLEWREDSDG